MVYPVPASRKSLLLLPVLSLTLSPLAQAAESRSLTLRFSGGTVVPLPESETEPLPSRGLGLDTPVPEGFAASRLESVSLDSTELARDAIALDRIEWSEPIPRRSIETDEASVLPSSEPEPEPEPAQPADSSAQSVQPTDLEPAEKRVKEPARSPRPPLLAQVIPTPGTTNSQVTAQPSPGAPNSATTFEISGGTQAGGNLFHRFDRLDVGTGQVANFQTDGSIKAVLSQVGGPASVIDGLLRVSGSNANLFVINPAGVLLGPNARLDLGGSFVATTADRLGFGDQWIDLLQNGFSAQTSPGEALTGLGFSAAASGGIVSNQGQLAVGLGQSLGLLGQAVVNGGTLVAPGGQVSLVAAQGGQRVSLAGGLLHVDLGRTDPEWSEPIGPTVGPTLRLTGTATEAMGLQRNADGSVSLLGGTAHVSGQIDVSQANGAGGQVNLLGKTVDLAGAVVDASGSQGGQIQVGGAFQGQGNLVTAQSVTVDGGSRLRADAIGQGNGGQVIVWSDGQTRFAGEATARGGALGGNGGLVETSGKQQLIVESTAKVETTAAQGQTGEWLLDPTDLNVVAVGGTAGIVGGTNSPIAASTIDRATLETALNGNNVNLQATNSIGVDTPIDTTANGGAGNLRLTAPTVNLNQRIRLNGNLSGTATTVNVAATGGVQNGIDAVATGGTVNLAAATYREGQTVVINRSLTLQGQNTAGTIISGDSDANGTGDHRVMRMTGAGSNVALQQLTIANGQGNIVDSTGSGLLTSAGRLAIADVEFRNNQATAGGTSGGAMRQTAGVVTIARSRFINNQASNHGGAIDLADGSLQVSDSTFSQNDAGLQGGAIDVDSRTTISVINSDFVDNTARWGGAIFSEGVTTIDSSSFRFNTATDDGGAVHSINAAAPLIIQGPASFSNNQATGNGGALFVNGTTQFLQGGVVGNSAGNAGGGIYNTGNLTLNNPNISANQALQGGGIANIGVGSILTVNNFLIENNVATGDFGGGVYSEQGTTSFADGSFRGNQATRFGGGLELNNSNATLQRIFFGANRSVEGGAGINLDNASSLTADLITFANHQANYGAAINTNIPNGPVLITNSGFLNNIANIDAGAIYGETDITIRNSYFAGNQAVRDGGAIVNDGNTARLIIDNSLLENNQAGRHGGAILAQNHGVLTILGTTFQNNLAATDGGAIRSSLTDVSINFSGFLNNQATFGGGLESSDGGTVQIADTTFRGNRATQDGGAIQNDSPVVMTIVRATLENNQADVSGGAINNNSELTIDRTILQNNQATFGGGAIWNNRNLTVDNSTFSTNTTTRFGAGIYNVDSLTVNGSTFQGGNAVAGAGLYTATELPGVTARTTIGGSLFDGNIATRGATSGDGGAIYNFAGDLAVNLSTFQNNQAQDWGGAIVGAAAGNVNITGTIFNANRATFGGSFHQNSGTLAIVDSRFLNNQSQQQGGAFDLVAVSNALIRRTLIQDNQAIGNGGGGIALGGTTNLTLDRVTLFQNQGIRGGGLDAQLGRNYQGTLNIIDSTIANNQSTSVNGGGMDVNPIVSSPVNISGSTISQNRSARDGGGIVFGDNAIFNISNTTIAENQANGRGGGIANFGTLNLTHTTVANNQSDADSSGGEVGGGLFSDILRITRLNNTIVANNQAPNGIDVAGDFVDQGNNLIGIVDGSTGFTNSALVGTSTVPINPLLAPLGNYGGLTQTMALLPGSAAIDAGNSAIATDQRGIGRVAAPDIGAFESRGFVLTAQGGGGQTTEINTAFGSPLVLSIASPFGEPVDGGQINFVAPASGSSAIFSSNPLSIPIVGGTAQISLSANSSPGTYDVLAASNGILPVQFTLTNTVPPPTPIPPTPIPPTPIPPTPIPPTPIPPVQPPASAPELPSFDPLLTYDPLPEWPLANGSTQGELSFSFLNDDLISMIDQQLSSEYRRYWSTEAADGSSDSNSLDSANDSTLAEIRELLRQAERSHQARSAVIYALFVPRDPAQGPNAVDFGAVQSANLALGRRLQTPVRDDDQLLLLLVPSAGAPVSQLLDVTRQEVLQQATLFRMAVSDPEDDISYRPLAQQMYQWLFAPVEPDVQRLQLNNVMYVVDAGLRTVPLAAMMSGNDFIVERYGLSIIPSVKLLQTSFGDPPPPPQTVAAGADQFMTLEALPGVPLELTAIANSQPLTKVLLNESFTQANLTAARTQNKAKMLHLATHAEFNAGDLPSSYLQLWDSQLTFDHIRGMGWQDLELLILSACATAISSPEAELGFAGLAAATGVESTIGSLWNVSDVGTLALMTEFYGNLRQSPLRFEALRRSQLSLLQGKTKIVDHHLSTAVGPINLPAGWNLPKFTEFRHPFYWSGFTLVGNPWW